MCHDAVWISLPERQYEASGRQNRRVSIDGCIADTITELWNCGTRTLGCCCGHGDTCPSVLVCASENPIHVRNLLDRLDERNWSVFKWERGKLMEW